MAKLDWYIEHCGQQMRRIREQIDSLVKGNRIFTQSAGDPKPREITNDLIARYTDDFANYERIVERLRAENTD